MKRTSIKNTRINGEVQKELSRIINYEIKDPRIHAMTSVTQVMVTPDLKECKAYISVLGDEQDQADTFAGFIRRELARSINLRNTPEITFYMDQSIEYAIHMSKKIDDVMKEQGDTVEDIQEEV